MICLYSFHTSHIALVKFCLYICHESEILQSKNKKTVGKNKMVLPSNYVMNAFSYSIPVVRYSLSDPPSDSLIGSAVATTAPWRLTSWLPQSCSNWQLSARDSFTDWKNWFNSRQHQVCAFVTTNLIIYKSSVKFRFPHSNPNRQYEVRAVLNASWSKIKCVLKGVL